MREVSVTPTDSTAKPFASDDRLAVVPSFFLWVALSVLGWMLVISAAVWVDKALF